MIHIHNTHTVSSTSTNNHSNVYLYAQLMNILFFKGYDVADSLTGDYKNQQESRDGDIVSGSYSFIEADGTRRVVQYTSE